MIRIDTITEMGELKKNNLSLKNKNKDLENELKSMKMLLKESEENLKSCKKKVEDKNNEVKDRDDTINYLQGYIHNYTIKVQKLENRAVDIRSTRNDVHYFEFYDSLLFDIKNLFDCPLSMVDLTKPCILPSGNTIQEDYLDELIKRKSLDPFNKNLRVQQKIVNRFATEVRDAINKSEIAVGKEVEKRRAAERAKLQAQQNSKSVEIQADLLIRSEDDITQIYLTSLIKYINFIFILFVYFFLDLNVFISLY